MRGYGGNSRAGVLRGSEGYLLPATGPQAETVGDDSAPAAPAPAPEDLTVAAGRVAGAASGHSHPSHETSLSPGTLGSAPERRALGAGHGGHHHHDDGPVPAPLISWSEADQAIVGAATPALELVLDAFIEDIAHEMESHPEFRAGIERTSSLERHHDLMVEHLNALLRGGPRDEDTQVRSRRVGRVHIANGVRPSWYVLLYNRWFAALHKVQDTGVQLPPLDLLRRLWQWDLGMSLDAYHEGLLSRWDAEKGELEETVTAFRRLASTDPLTGLANRSAVEEVVRGFEAQSGRSGFFVLMDLDNFKNLNDRLGHPSGDRALQVIGKALAGSVRRSDLVARIGGDEFCLWNPGEQSTESLWEQLRRIVSGLPLRSLDIGVSAGAARFGVDGEDFLSLYHAADEALYSVKRNGRGGLKLAGADQVRHWA